MSGASDVVGLAAPGYARTLVVPRLEDPVVGVVTSSAAIEATREVGSLDSEDRVRCTAWMTEGTARLDAEVLGLTDDQLREPSLLPGWTRAHVVVHVALNAAGLVNLLDWARTGVETPMYPSIERRASDIEECATLPPEQIRARHEKEVSRLAEAIETLPEPAWQAPIRTILGRQESVSIVPWLRVREVWIHAIDLAAGMGFSDVPEALASRLLGDAVATLSTRPDCPGAILTPTDGPASFRLGPPDAGKVEVDGSLAELLAWVLGRGGLSGTGLVVSGPIPDEDLPALPRWI